MLPPEISERLVRAGLVGEADSLAAERLTGGVSSDIWRVSAGGRVLCVKRAMAKLAVKDDWFAPVERNRFERQWYEVAGRAVPGSAPRVIAHDDAAMFFVMEWLDPADHRLWKADLMAARVDVGLAAAVGGRLAAVHGATARDAALAAMFPTGPLFEALRLEPYLRATGRRHPGLAAALEALADRTAALGIALVHGDASPKNIMAGPDGPVFLDAECAWYGDPAFDLAFCLNHLLLKCLAVPAAAPAFLASFDALKAAYLAGVAWESPAELEPRAAALLPALFLARVDGKSPVEYVIHDEQRERVRRVAVPLVPDPPASLAEIRESWGKEIGVG